MILISSHLDKVTSDQKLGYRDGSMHGLLDNILGVILTYITIADDHNIARLEREGKIRVYHNTSEEWGILDPNCPTLVKDKDIAIALDVCANSELYKDVDFSIENIYGFTKEELEDFRSQLEWQGFKFHFKKYTGNPDEEDEAFYFKKRGIKTFSFIIPIHGVDDGWHRIQQDNTVSMEQILRCRQGLKRVLNHFIEP